DDDDPSPGEKFVNETLPPSLFAIVPPAPPWLHGNVAISRGYLDDACDGFVDAALTLKDGTKLTASARICAGPPVLVPDALFVRNLADDLDQVLHEVVGEVADEERSEEHTSELQSRGQLVCRLLPEKKKRRS